MKNVCLIAITLFLLILAGCAGEAALSGQTSHPPALAIATTMPPLTPTDATTQVPTPTDTPTVEPPPARPLTVKQTSGGGRTSRALINGMWVYQVGTDIFSIPLDAPPEQPPTCVWSGNGFPFFLPWGDDIFIFASHEWGDPMRGTLIDPKTGEYSVFDMRQKYFYFPCWTEGQIAFGVGDDDIRILNRETGNTDRVMPNLGGYQLHGMTKEYVIAFDNSIGEHLRKRGDDYDKVIYPGMLQFYCNVDGGALIRVDYDIILVTETNAYILFENVANEFGVKDTGYGDSYANGYALCEAREAIRDVNDNIYFGEFMICSEGIVITQGKAFTDRPKSFEGGAVFCEELTEDDVRPITAYPLFDISEFCDH